MKVFYYLMVVSLVNFSSGQHNPSSTCIFNNTLCSCRKAATPGNCLRHRSGRKCVVGKCSEKGMTCDCSGDSLCSIDRCNSWVASKELQLNSHIGEIVSCKKTFDMPCLKEIQENLKPKFGKEKKNNTAPEYRMVQVGEASSLSMFNMSFFMDQNHLIQKSYNMHNRWGDRESLRQRFISMRIYEEPDTNEKSLCAIYNTYEVSDDGFGNMLVLVELKGIDGQVLDWRVCDDQGECRGSKSDILYARHGLLSNYTDGWCVRPLRYDGKGIMVKFYGVERMKGLVLQAVDGLGRDKVFHFSDTVKAGFKGEVGLDGLVRGGEMPAIVFNLRGIQVPNYDQV